VAVVSHDLLNSTFLSLSADDISFFSVVDVFYWSCVHGGELSCPLTT